jgi:hypothetical protein
MEAIAAAMEPKDHSIGWICAPTYDLSERVFNQIVVVIAGRLRHRIVSLKEHERRLVLRNMSGGLSEIRGKSADNPVSLLGEGLDFVIVDEAARMKPQIWENHLSQRLIDKQGWALLISTPKGKGYLYELFRRGQGSDPTTRAGTGRPGRTHCSVRTRSKRSATGSPSGSSARSTGQEFLEGSGGRLPQHPRVRDAAVPGP